MYRGSFKCSAGIAVVTAVLLTYASVAWAFDTSAYYPLEVGTAWTYDVERRITMASGLDAFESYMGGRAKEEVTGLSRLSTVGTPVYKVRRRVKLCDGSTSPCINREYVMHMSSSKKGVLTHGVGSHVHKRPQIFLQRESSIDGNEFSVFRFAFREELNASNQLVNLRQLGEMREKSALKSQTIEVVEVPAGKFRKTIKRLFAGSVYGELGGHRIRVGSMSATNWFAKGVGLVRSNKTYYLKAQTPEGALVVTQSNTERLISYEVPPRRLRGK